MARITNLVAERAALVLSRRLVGVPNQLEFLDSRKIRSGDHHWTI